MIEAMETIRISDIEAARDLPGLLARLRVGIEIVIESNERPVAVVRAPEPAFHAWTAKEALSLLPMDSTAVVDEDFARDIEEAIAAHRETLNPPAWD